MKKRAIYLLALLACSPALAEDKLGGPSVGGVPPPVTAGQILGTDGTNPEWETLGGGNGNCYIVYNGPGSYSLQCPGFGPGGGSGGVTFAGDLSGTPTTQSVIGIRTKAVPTLASGYLHYNGTAFVWDTPAGGGPPGPGSITDAMLANPYSGVGACTSGQFVNALNRNAAPTCGTPPAGGGGGITSITAGTGLTGGTITTTGTIALGANPAGGQLNYAPLASPTFTGTVTFPGGGTATSTAFTIPTAVNLTLPYSGSPTLTVTGTTQFNMTAYGTNMVLSGDLNVNGGKYMWGGAGVGGTCPGGQYVSALNTGLAITCGTPTGGSFAPLTNPTNGQNNYAPLASPSFTGLVTSPTIFLTNTTTTSILLGNTTTSPYAAESAGGDGMLRLSGGSFVAAGGWTATSNPNNSSAVWQVGANAGGAGTNPGAQLYLDSGLTAGSVFTPTMTAQFNQTGLMLAGALGIGQQPRVTGYSLEITQNQNGDTGMQVLNNSAGANATTSLYLWNGTASGKLNMTGTGNNGLAGHGPNTFMIGADGSGGVGLIVPSDAPGTPSMTFQIGPSLWAQFQQVPWNGLSINTNNQTGLQVGDMTISSVGAANYNITSGAYYNGSNWISTSGQGPLALINNIGPGQIGFYTSTGAATVGQVIGPWTETARIGSFGVLFNHMGTDQNAGYAAPSVANGTLMFGSGDAMGWINATAWPVTLNFGQRFIGNPACVAMGGSGQAGILYLMPGQNSGDVQFGCVNWANDPAAGNCPPPFWFQYICGDMAAVGTVGRK